MTWIVYVLRDPRDRRIRYVGWTSKPQARRLREHVYDARRGLQCHRAKWIRVLLALGLAPTIYVIERGAGDAWQVRERHWIARCRSIGCDLTNATDGGDGVVNPTADVRERIAAAQRARFADTAAWARASAGQLRRYSDATQRAAASAAQLLRFADPLERQAISRGRSGLGAKLTPAQVREIRGTKMTGADLARRFAVSQQTICDVRAGRRWKHV